MPTDFRILPHIRAVHVRSSGVVSLQEILAYEERLAADPGFDPTYTEVIDMRQVERLDLSHADVATIVGYEQNHARYAGVRRVAVVAPADLEFGLARMYEMLGDDSPMETEVFRNLDEACERMGLPVSDFDGH